jgi:hypothetical protein
MSGWAESLPSPPWLYPYREDAQSTRLDGPVFRPFVPISLCNEESDTLRLTGLVDTGADSILASDLLAEQLGIHGGIRSTFTNIPDAPVSRFILNMQGAKKGLIVNSTNLCYKPKRNRANANLGGQNGRREHLRPIVRAVKCGKAHKKRHKRHRRR